MRSFQNIGEDFTFQDNVTKVTGKHTFKGGYELIRTRYNGTSGALPGGTYNFGGTDMRRSRRTRGIRSPRSCSAASHKRNLHAGVCRWLPRWWAHQRYFQDDWKPVRGLTVNLGLRWSYETPYQTKYGQQSQFDPTAARSDHRQPRARSSTLQGALAKKDLNNFAPRVGLAWNFKPNWVFRRSFGMIHQDIQATQTYINYDEYLATATLAVAGRRSAPGLPPVRRARPLPVQCEPGRFGAVRRHQLLDSQRKLVRPEHAHAVRDELVRRHPVGLPEQLGARDACIRGSPASA